MPSWIQTAEVAAAIGWKLHTVAPAPATWRTQAGEVAAAGSITLVVRPSGIAG
jgi:hypothetical protein